MSETDLFRSLLDEYGIPYEIQDFKSRRCTYIEDTLDGEPFAIEFDEPLDGIPGTLGAMRELTFTSMLNITGERASEVLCKALGVADA